jgi:DeoR/GlpR family transcriptional regulator of sugar metabolism
VLELARLLIDRLPLTVITNFLPVINLYSREPQTRLIATAGEYASAYESFVGQSVVDAAASLQSDVFFMSATAVSQGNCYHPAEDAAAVKRSFMASAAQKVLLFDNTKLSRRALHLQAHLTDFDAVIVDDGLSADQERMLRDSVPSLIVADTSDIDVKAVTPRKKKSS